MEGPDFQPGGETYYERFKDGGLAIPIKGDFDIPITIKIGRSENIKPYFYHLGGGFY